MLKKIVEHFITNKCINKCRFFYVQISHHLRSGQNTQSNQIEQPNYQTEKWFCYATQSMKLM